MENCVPNIRRRRRGLCGRQRRRRRLRSVARLTDDLISEILARVPYRSLCRFKCVSRSWLALCSCPDMIRKTLSGFFFRQYSADIHFVSASGRRFPLMEGSLFSFLRPYSLGIDIVDSCNGLLLFDRHNCLYNVHGLSRYFVCNPATGNWIDLPDPNMEPAWRSRFNPEVLWLGFDPAESPHFRVFWVVPVSNMPQKVAGVQIYSSETRGWAAFRQSGWGNDTIMRSHHTRTAFFNGTLHLATGSSSIVTVDIDGKTWRTIPTPRSFGLIGLSRGCFYAVEDHPDDIHNNNKNGYRLSIWALEDYAFGGHKWILKHTAKPFAPTESYAVHAIHPEDPLIFLTSTTEVGRAIRRALVSYDFMNNKVHTIETLGYFDKKIYMPVPYPYIPCFAKWLSDGH